MQMRESIQRIDVPPENWLDGEHVQKAGFGVHLPNRLGPAVPLTIPTRGKEQRIERSQQFILTDATPDNLARFNDDSSEISLLRAVSAGLRTVDVDNRDFTDDFLQCNPLNECHISSGKRGALLANARKLFGLITAFMKSGTRTAKNTHKTADGKKAPTSWRKKHPHGKWKTHLLIIHQRVLLVMVGVVGMVLVLGGYVITVDGGMSSWV